METKSILHIIRNPYGHSVEDICIARNEAADLIERQARRIQRYESCFGNIETLIDGKVDTKDGEDGSPEPNDYMSIRMMIEEAMR